MPEEVSLVHGDRAGLEAPRDDRMDLQSPRAGFRGQFAGEFGTLEEFPLPAGNGNPGFMGATEIVSTGELWKRWMAGPGNRIDSQFYFGAGFGF